MNARPKIGFYAHSEWEANVGAPFLLPLLPSSSYKYSLYMILRRHIKVKELVVHPQHWPALHPKSCLMAMVFGSLMWSHGGMRYLSLSAGDEVAWDEKRTFWVWRCVQYLKNSWKIRIQAMHITKCHYLWLDFWWMDTLNTPSSKTWVLVAYNTQNGYKEHCEKLSFMTYRYV